jgi:glucose/arabinose dehydrogenase
MKRTRRQWLRAVGAGAVAATAGCSDSLLGGSDPPPEGPTVALEPVAAGLTSPTQLVADPDSGRRYVLDQTGEIRAIGPYGLESEPFLDLSDEVIVSKERGLLGMAFHPEYPDDPRLFLRYSAHGRGDLPEDYTHTEVLAEFHTDDDGRVVRDSERPLMEIPTPTPFHNAGSIAFGPDGYLYVPMGESNNEELAQDVETSLLGAIHRIDVDSEGEDRPYGVPEDNPLVGEPGRSEYYAWGFRNPWKLSFHDGDLLVGDVGPYSYEEVDRVEKGENYGWPYRHGGRCRGWEDGEESGENCGVDPETVPGGEFADPVVTFERGRANGFAVIGGYVYDREDLPALAGQYLFGNHTTDPSEPSGDLLLADPGDDAPWSVSRPRIENGPDGRLNRVIASLGRDADGHVYLLTTAVPLDGDRFAHDSGEVFKIVPPDATEASIPRAPAVTATPTE